MITKSYKVLFSIFLVIGSWCSTSLIGEVGAAFQDAESWYTFDPGANGVGTDPDGYGGAVFDGRYIYFVPSHNGTDYHGEVLRYDTQGTLNVVSSWSTFDPLKNGVGASTGGYDGAVFDGRYVYFVPRYNTGPEGEVLRYDTQGAFNSVSSWSAFDPGANDVGTDPNMYAGAVFDGRYIYFVPSGMGNVRMHGEVLRYDTQGAFSSVSSWSTFDPGANGVGTDPDGYNGAAFDGRYIYFAPSMNGIDLSGNDFHGEVLRYDTQGGFSSASSWTTFDPGANGVGTDPDGYCGAVFDGRYIYFAPLRNDGWIFHGEVLRYDTQGGFDNASSWSTFDPGANGVGTAPDGYGGAVFDGRYLYFIPGKNNTEFHGEVLRYDTQGSFNGVSSWSTFDPGANGVGTAPDGYAGAAFDGHYIYFAPGRNNTDFHGEVLRYDIGIPILEILANSSEGPISISPQDTLSIAIGLVPKDFSSANADWWVVERAPEAWHYYDVVGGSWTFVPGLSVTHQGSLFDFGPFEVFNTTGLPLGTYTFYFGVDLNMNGSLDFDQLSYDSVVVNVTE